MLNPDAVRRWKADTAGAYTRLIVLGEKAQDNGLTDEERAEYERLEEFVGRRLVEFLREAKK